MLNYQVSADRNIYGNLFTEAIQGCQPVENRDTTMQMF